METIIQIPTINDSEKDFERLFAIQASTVGRDHIRFNFSRCNFLRPNAVAFLGGAARQVENRGGKVTFDWDSMADKRVLKSLQKNKFAESFSYPASSSMGNAIPYREDNVLDPNGIMDYLTEEWVGRGWLNVSSRVRDAIAGKMWEVYYNAFEHADSPIGVFSCGQYYPNQKHLLLTIVDFGVGIAESVRSFFLKSTPRASELRDTQCMWWAFGPGNTTSTTMARGLGLDLLKEFIRLNNGKLEVYSNKGYAMIDNQNIMLRDRETSFHGTMFHMTIVCDETLYIFEDEDEEEEENRIENNKANNNAKNDVNNNVSK